MAMKLALDLKHGANLHYMQEWQRMQDSGEEDMLTRSPSTCVQSADCQWSFGEYIYGSCCGSL
jgi:hypothetical protein